MQKQKSPNIEAVKEVARWVVLFIAGWIITQILSQIILVPENYDLKVWVFTFSIPIRLTLSTGLTVAGRYVDKLLFEQSKQSDKYKLSDPKGLLPF